MSISFLPVGKTWGKGDTQITGDAIDLLRPGERFLSDFQYLRGAGKQRHPANRTFAKRRAMSGNTNQRQSCARSQKRLRRSCRNGISPTQLMSASTRGVGILVTELLTYF